MDPLWSYVVEPVMLKENLTLIPTGDCYRYSHICKQSSNNFMYIPQLSDVIPSTVADVDTDR